MADSKVDICNSALVKIGAQVISEFSNSTPAGAMCVALYDLCRKEVLRSHPWNFAIKRFNLSEQATAPTWGPGNAFPLPADCLRVLDVEDNDIDWYEEIVGGVKCIITDSSTCKIKYISNIETTGLFDANFDEALAYRIAKDLAIPLTSSSTLREQMERAFDRHVAQARSFDAQVGTPQQVIAGDWINSRY